MAEQNRVSPLLDGFSIGNPVWDHCGSCCCPAVRGDSEQKYIVKIVSIPASQSQLDALLITGAYRDSAEAAEYFRQQAGQIEQEAALLRELAQGEGFAAFEGVQIEPMGSNRIGYEVYLLNEFRFSLNRYMHRHPITHLEAVNMGIDLCEALTACRDKGWLYIDLKPANIFLTGRKKFQIGDLGFTALDSLRFTSMPEKCRSPYTAPELLEDLNTINTTADTYALGMILYQLFNNGQLPQDLSTTLPAPAAADERMTGILQKACAPLPADRWETPAQMGEALREYLQLETVNDTPIMEALPGRAPDQTMRLFSIPEQTAAPAEPAADAAEDVPAEQTTAPESAPGAAVPEPDAEPEVPAEAPAESAEEAGASGFGNSADLEAAAAAFEFAAMDTAEQPADFPEKAPKQKEIPIQQEIDELQPLLKSEKPKKKKHRKEPNVKPVVVRPKKKHHIVRVLVILLLLAMLAAGGVWGYLYYTEEYLQNVRAISVTGSAVEMVVTVDSDISDGYLTAVCTDTYGSSLRQTVRGGEAVFQNLSADSLYKISLEMEGFHKLTGQTTDIFTTDSVTNVVEFSAAMGSEEGSVTLSLTVDGHEPDQWQVTYTADGEPELGHTFSGHSATVTGLTMGKTYTFRLETGDHEEVSGVSSTQFTLIPIVSARDVTVLSCSDGVLSVTWGSDNFTAETVWNVRCCGNGYDKTIQTTDFCTEFTGISSDAAYTIDVTAEGMTQKASVNISANPVTVTAFNATEYDSQTINVSWSYSGTAPEGGWILQYTVDNGYYPTAVKCSEPTAVVEGRIPGAEYHFTIMTTSNVSVFNNVHTFQSGLTANYRGHEMLENSIYCGKLVPTPEDGWDYESINGTTTFTVGQRISALLYSTSRFQLGTAGEDIIDVMFVYRDAEGNVLTELIGEESQDWYALWFDGYKEDRRYCVLDIPTSPLTAGQYSLTIYFNGYVAAAVDLTIV